MIKMISEMIFARTTGVSGSFKILVCLSLAYLISCSTFKTHNINNPPIVVKLTKQNAVVLDGAIDEESMYKLAVETTKLHQNLLKHQPIYLVIKSHGGYVDAMKNYSKLAKSLNREVITITLVAESAAAFLVQNLGKRYIVFNGRMMFHEVSTGIQSVPFRKYVIPWFYKEIQELDELEGSIAERLEMSLSDYRENIYGDNWWLNGANQLLEANAADRLAILKCDEFINSLISDCILEK